MSTREPFVWRSRIHFVDTDASQRIHYSALFRHFEAAEEEFMRSLGYTFSAMIARGFSVPRVHVEADYLAALGHDDEVMITVQVGKLGTSSYTLRFGVYREDTSELAASGALTAVCISPGNGKSQPLPDDLRQALKPHLA